MKAEFKQLGNPFSAGEIEELYQLGIKDVMSDDTACAVKKIHSVGKRQCQEFLNSRLFKWTVTLDTPIKNNKFSLFEAANTKGQFSKCLLIELKVHVWFFFTNAYVYSDQGW